jgi:formate dehydrogenase major subunit
MDAPAESTVLDCARNAGIEIPTLCHDPRLKPFGGCRLCIVEIGGNGRPVTACDTVVREGMTVETNTPEIMGLRRTLLQLLANEYPAEAAERGPDKEFHRWLPVYGVTPPQRTVSRDRLDETHPYIYVNPSQCILCSRCVRICEEVQGQFVWKLWNRGDATCVMPDTGGTLLESACVSCGACVDTCPTGALEDKTLLQPGLQLRWTRTTCPYCGTGCEMNVGSDIAGDQPRIVTSKPVPDAPVSKGHLCSKGRYAFGFVHSQDRVLHPMLRQNGAWLQVSWDEAIDATTTLLRSTVERHGADSVGILGSARSTNEENYLAQKFARVVLATNNVDCCARLCHGPTAAAMKRTLGTGAATNSYEDIERARVILMCGCNPTENHPIIGARVKQAALRGTRLIVIDPRKIELSEFAEVHLRLRAGTNVALLNALACALVEEDLVDREFLQERIDDFPAFDSFIRDFSPEAMAPVCGVVASEIRRAARLYALGKPSYALHGLGMTEHVQGTDGVSCLVNLALLTGNIGRSGAGVNPLRGQNNVQGAAHMGCEPAVLPGYIGIDSGTELFERVCQTAIPRRKGLNVIEMLEEARHSRFKALWAIGYDILQTHANAHGTEAALRKLDGLIVQDMFFNQTAREFATIFLPACSSFEKDGTFMNAERRVQRVRQALPPLGESKSDWEILCAVGQAMGFARQFQFASAEEIWEEIRQVWPAGAGISYRRLESGGLQWPCLDEQHPGTSILHTETFSSKKRTALPCIPFTPTPEAVSEEYPFLLITGRTLQQFNSGTMTQRTSHNRLRRTDLLDISPADAERLGVRNGELLRIRSRYGHAILPARLTTAVPMGELFTTFHDPKKMVNYVTGPFTDGLTQAPEYKVTAVQLEKLPAEEAQT